jgi:hypothetical protein
VDYPGCALWNPGTKVVIGTTIAPRRFVLVIDHVRSVSDVWNQEKSVMTRYVFIAAAITLVVVFSGCKEKSKVEGSGDRKLTLSQPSDESINRGGTAEVTVKIDRKNFRDPVIVKFEDLPAGVEVQDRDAKIGSEQSSGKFTLKASDDATVVSNHPAKVTAIGPDDMRASETFKITVKDKK